MLSIHKPSPNPRLIPQENSVVELFQVEMIIAHLKGESNGAIRYHKAMLNLHI